ncbi:MAG: hypothetical protein H6622_16360 [Halobacteriovoraceae bacterium]|nr:hypothetical protein [Halobacteriovoraceae bacterium]
MFKYLFSFCLLTSFIQFDVLAKSENKDSKSTPKSDSKKRNNSTGGSFIENGGSNIGHGTSPIGTSSSAPVFGGYSGSSTTFGPMFKKGDKPEKKKKKNKGTTQSGSFIEGGSIGYGTASLGGGSSAPVYGGDSDRGSSSFGPMFKKGNSDKTPERKKKGRSSSASGPFLEGGSVGPGTTSLGGGSYEAPTYGGYSGSSTTYGPMFKETQNSPMPEDTDTRPSYDPETDVGAGNDPHSGYSGSSSYDSPSYGGGDYSGPMVLRNLKEKAKEKLERMRASFCETFFTPAYLLD